MNNGGAPIGCLFVILLIVFTTVTLPKWTKEANEQYQIEYRAKLKVCQEKEWMNTSVCKQLLFDEKVEQMEKRV